MRIHYMICLIISLGGLSCGATNGYAEPATEQTRYVCPMHPQIQRDRPGTCPICGMALVHRPEMFQADATQDNTITIDSQLSRNMGLRLETVTRRTLSRHIEAVGYITYNEDKIVHIHPRTQAAWIEKLHVHVAGQRISKGEVLLEYYSPEIVVAQEELLLAVRSGSSLLPSAKSRLRLLGVSETVIEQVIKTNKALVSVPLYAPMSGVVSTLQIRHGMFIEPEMELLSLADLSEVWVIVSVFSHQTNWLKAGDTAEIQVSALPGQRFSGKVDYIYPELDAVTRTLQVRLKFANDMGLLQPNMFADVVIHGHPKQNTLTVARDAVIFSGHETHVIRAAPNGTFEPIIVRTGMQTPGYIEILDGLQPGEHVVTSGQFLIDSEANLRASLRRLQSEHDTHAQHH